MNGDLIHTYEILKGVDRLEHLKREVHGKSFSKRSESLVFSAQGS